jgi:hypothetical protein
MIAMSRTQMTRQVTSKKEAGSHYTNTKMVVALIMAVSNKIKLVRPAQKGLFHRLESFLAKYNS